MLRLYGLLETFHTCG